MFKGSIVALVTPFDEKDEVDEGALKSLVEWHLREGTDAIVCVGTTGEAPTLSDEEKLKVFKICVETARGKCPIIAGAGTNNTKHSVYLTERAKEIGVQGILAVVPYYNRPTPEGCHEHFSAIAKVGLPVIVYHHPKRTGVTLPMDSFCGLASIPNVVAIKEASGDLDFAVKVKKASTLSLLSGDDGLTVDMMEMGGVGVISVAANVIPKELKKITDLASNKKFQEARALLEKNRPLIDSLFLEVNPQCVKYVLSLMGKCRSTLRLPLMEPSKENQERLSDLFSPSSIIRG